MKVIIAGVGKLGEYIARLLVKENNEVVLIDRDFAGKAALINNEDVDYIEGNALDSNILMQADVENCDLLISVMKNDTDNVICSVVGKKLGAKHTISRIISGEYGNLINLTKDELGLSMTINPKLMTAIQIAQALNIPSALDATSFLKGKIEVVSLRIKENSRINNMSVREISSKLKKNLIICAVEKNGETIIPTGDTIISIGDKIHITGKRKDINSFLKYTNLISEKTKKVIIAGGSDVSIALSTILLDMGMNVKIIENDEARCKILSEKLPNALIIHGDVSNQNILYEEGIKNCDAFVALTSLDEENIVYSMFASSLNVPKVITKVNHINLDGVIQKAGIETVIAPHKIAANQIMQYVRAIENKGSSSCEAIYTYQDNLFEMVEFKVKEDFKAIGSKIRELKIKDNLLIAAIQRGKNIIYPSGNDEIKLNDTILIISKDKALRKLNDLVK